MTDCGKCLLACEEGKDAWLQLGDPSGDTVSFHGHRAVFVSRSPFLRRLLREPQNYYGASVYFDAPGAARHAFDVLRYLYLGAGCLSMEDRALEAYCVVFARLEMREDLRAARGLLAAGGGEAAAEGADGGTAAPHEERREKRRAGPGIVLTVLAVPASKRRRRVAPTADGARRRSDRLKKPRRSARVRQLTVGS